MAGSRCVRTCVPISGAYIKEPFITRYARAGAAKKAAGCGEEARGASLSYLEPFPVNLGPPLSHSGGITHTRPHTLATYQCNANALTHTRARACDGIGQRDRFRRVRSTLHLAVSAARCCEPDNHFSLDDAPTTESTTIFREQFGLLREL